MNSFISVRDLKKYYKSSSKKEVVRALDGVDLDIGEGEILGLIGESGSGKSTLAKVLLNLEEPTKGQVLVGGRDHRNLVKEDRLAYYRTIQMIFQNPFDVLDSKKTIERTLIDVLKIHNLGQTKDQRKDLVIRTLEKASMTPAEDFLSRYPHELSGGQLQRIAILRSMLLEPKFLVADEPVTMLDVSVRSEIINLLLKMRQDLGTSMVFISHDIATTSYISDRITVMYLGQVVEEGPTSDLVEDPLHPYTKVLIASTASLEEETGSPESIDLGLKPKNQTQDKAPACYFYSRCPIACKQGSNQMPQLEDIGQGRKIRCFSYER